MQISLLDGVDDNDLELVGNFGHEGGDLLHESVDAALAARLKHAPHTAQALTTCTLAHWANMSGSMETNKAQVTYFQQGGDGQCGDASVDVSDEVLEVKVARGDGGRVLHRHLHRQTYGHRNGRSLAP